MCEAQDEVAMRISIVGTSRSGKTTLGRSIASGLAIPFIELDAINWQPGWRDLNSNDPEEFRRQVELAICPQSWVVDGNYDYGAAVGLIVRQRATHIVWLDYNRSTIMMRVIRRSFVRAITGREVWPGTGNRERFRQWFRPSSPIRWAWSTWERGRRQYESLLADKSIRNLSVVRLEHPRTPQAFLRSFGLLYRQPDVAPSLRACVDAKALPCIPR
jgi:adenylate kinase family enzyme